MTVTESDSSTTTTVRLIPVFQAMPGFEDELAMLLADLQEASRLDAGCVEYAVFTDGESSDTFVLYEEWTSSAALAAHNEQKHVKDFLAAAKPILARELKVYRSGSR
jgi:quinol monooxygenase YgiN